MFAELESKEIFELARSYAYAYMDGIEDMDVFPSKKNLDKMKAFDEPIPEKSTNAVDVLNQLNNFGSPATIAQIGGRYFGFVNGGALPVSIGVKWLSDVWDQNGGLFLTSPINAKLESVCQNWLKEIFSLPEETVAGFVSGTSMANLCGLLAARFHLLKNLNWDINEEGLNGAPKLRIIAHAQVHASIKKTLSILGYGKNNIEWIPSDSKGRLSLEHLPELDNSCLVLLQAGNVNSGAFDNFDKVCDRANAVGAWTHIDGAFGLWAAAANSLKHLTKGIEKASSWAVDGHKTLNTPYDSGIILCKHPDALISSLQATGEYLIFSEQRDPLFYTPELSKRARAIELWATIKYLGREGIDTLVSSLHLRAKQLAKGLEEIGFQIVNDPVFSQVLVATDNDEETKQILAFLQNSGECWLGSSSWQGKTVMRVSICSWATTEEDINRTVRLFGTAKRTIAANT